MVYVSIAGLDVVKVADPGNLRSERVILRVAENTSLIHYVLINSSAADESGEVYDMNQHVFWFPDVVANQGDYVRLYSRVGEFNTQPGTFAERPAIFHNFYWGKNHAVWVAASNAVVVFRVQNWISKKIL